MQTNANFKCSNFKLALRKEALSLVNFTHVNVCFYAVHKAVANPGNGARASLSASN